MKHFFILLVASLALTGCKTVSQTMPEGKLLLPPPQWVDYCQRNPSDYGCTVHEDETNDRQGTDSDPKSGQFYY